MTITLYKLSNAYNTLIKLSKERLPIKLSYAINKNIHYLENDYKFYKNSMYELYRTYFETDENGQFISKEIDENTSSYKIKFGQEAELTQKINELNNTDVNTETYEIEFDLLITSAINVEANIFDDLDFLIVK